MQEVQAGKQTYREYNQLPEGTPYELIDGELVKKPAPEYNHQRLIGKLHLLMAPYVNERKVGEVILSPIDVQLTDYNVFQPDLVYVSNERRHIITKRVMGAPDLVVEVLSPSTGYYDLRRKKSIYEQEGVTEYWIIDPLEKSIEVLVNSPEGFRRHDAARDRGSVKSLVIDGFSVDLEEFFG